MTAAEVVAGILWLALTAYAVLAGADFGGGVWDLFATGPRAAEQRSAVAEAMGPVWEANHVWLIFMITGLFTAFPTTFGVLGLALYLPFTIAMIGIVLRGASFAFRAHGGDVVGPLSTWGVVFGVASVITPISLGTAAAAVASGAIHAPGGQLASGFLDGWTTPLAAVIGLFALSMCAYLAATYLMVENEERPALLADFRRRAIGAAVVSGVLALIALPISFTESPRLLESLTGRGLPLFALALINGPLALWAVWRSQPRIARVAVAAQVVFVLWAWAVGQWPYLVPPDLTIAGTAAPAATLTAAIIVIAIGGLILIPSLWLLFRVFKARNPQAHV
ncbi:MAG TPA: cytochrome d ubiquinol oxidase subunit II [Candidatus Dormibacteraeota bacterium]|nr:cytochrome d ubiquinol oxidase subunit II [Candidatus Dormibacteraeota bacterium]